MDKQQILLMCVFAAVSLLVFWMVRLLLGHDSDRLRHRLGGTQPVPSQPQVAGAVASAVLGQIGRMARPFEPVKADGQSSLRRRLMQAGIYSPGAGRLLVGCKVLLLLAGAAGGYAAGLWAKEFYREAVDHPWLLVLVGSCFGGLMGDMLPTLWLRVRINAHQRALEIALPNALDLMVICVEAGLTMDSAMRRVGQEIVLVHPELARELEMAHLETQMGLPRTEALRNLGRRTGSAAIQGMVAMLVQAERFGTGVANALRIHAESLRIKRQYMAEEMANKTSVKLTFPVVLFIFPVVLMVLLGPTVINWMNSQF